MTVVQAETQYVSQQSDSCRVDVDLTRRAERPVSRRLFGKFTEHLGRNVYGGMWAQVLRNPGFEGWRYFAKSKDGLASMYRHALPAVPPELLAADAEQLAVWWMPYGRGEVAYRLEGGARNSELCQCLEVRQLATPEVGLQQPHYLPTHRTGEFVVSLWARSPAAGGQLRLSVATLEGESVGAATLSLPGPDWQRLSATLTVDRAKVRRGQPLLFRIGLASPATVCLDQVFVFPADHVVGFDPDVVRLLRESRLPLLRWPGGNFVSGYHWKDGIGPVDDRPTRHNHPWKMPEYNHVGTDEFLAFCRAVGCEPMICVNAGDGTAEEAAHWVEYCNGSTDTKYGALRASHGHPEPYGVRYWEIGNELYGGWQIGHCTAEQYAQRYRAFHEAMHAVDPSILFIANGNDPAWNERVIAGAKDLLRSLSLHTLTGGGARDETDAEKVFGAFMGFPVWYAGYLDRLARQMAEAGLEPELALTELQVFTNRPNLPNNASLTEALWTAQILNACARTGGMVELVTHSALVNHGGGLRKERELVYPNPVHWCHHLYSTQDCDRLAPVTVACPSYDSPGAPSIDAAEDVPYLDCLALTDAAGEKVSVFLVNRHPEAGFDVRLHVAGWTGKGDARVQTLTGDSYMAANDWEHPNRVAPMASTIAVADGEATVRCPRHSLVRVSLARR
jgi:alpha-N-arabinofuranosidase